MQKHKRNTTGFTLIELLIVMVIIGLLAAFVAPRFFGQEKKAKQRGAKGQIALLESALDTYRLDVGRYPSTEQGLEGMVLICAKNSRWTPGETRMCMNLPANMEIMPSCLTGLMENPVVKRWIWISSAGKISENDYPSQPSEKMQRNKRVYTVRIVGRYFDNRSDFGFRNAAHGGIIARCPIEIHRTSSGGIAALCA